MRFNLFNIRVTGSGYRVGFLNLLVLAFLFSSCAQIVAPTGGPKDITPPRTVKYVPDSAAVNFNARNITIVFDEYIELNDLQKQLVVSPPMHRMPEVSLKGKILSIVLKDTLRKNTTYVLNFGNSIRDLKEGNSVENFQYVFSTGNHIDTLSLKGTIKNMLDQKTEKGILVMLYEDLSDSAPYKKIPSYFAKTKDDGSYKIYNIRPGVYKAFALKDANSDYLYNLPTEAIAFSDSVIDISKNTSLNLFMFQEAPRKQKLMKAYFFEPGHLILAFAKPIGDSLKLRFLSSQPKEKPIYEYSVNRDTLHYWFADEWKDSLKIELTEGKQILDTVRLRALSKDQVVSGRGEKRGLRATVNVSQDRPFDLMQEITIKFNHPINSVKTNGIYLTSGLKRINYTNTVISDDSKRNYFFQFPLAPDSMYKLFIPASVFTDIFGFSNDTIKTDFKTQEEKYYGTLKMNLKMKYRIKSILQLMNAGGQIFKEVSSEQGIFKYVYLPPGEYKLRIIYDQNGDDKWTPGDYLEMRRPETVLYYSNPITIRSNWDLELEWKIE